MPMSTSYVNALASAGAAAITHLAIVNTAGAEISAARKPVTWTAPSNGLIRPTADIVFDIPVGGAPAGWRGFTALTAGTNHGGEAVPTEGAYGSAGTYTILAASTSIAHNAI